MTFHNTQSFFECVTLICCVYTYSAFTFICCKKSCLTIDFIHWVWSSSAFSFTWTWFNSTINFTFCAWSKSAFTITCAWSNSKVCFTFRAWTNPACMNYFNISISHVVYYLAQHSVLLVHGFSQHSPSLIVQII